MADSPDREHPRPSGRGPEPEEPSGSTRDRLVAAAAERFRAQGYDATSAAAIAADAGVTERTFFRYFPTKADVLVAHWADHAAAVRDRLVSAPGDAVDAVRDALDEFAERLTDDVDEGRWESVRLALDPSAEHAVTAFLLGLEDDVAAAIAGRSGRDDDDAEVRVAATAAVGVLRTAVRAFVADPSVHHAADLVDDGMRQIRRAFDGL